MTEQNGQFKGPSSGDQGYPWRRAESIGQEKDFGKAEQVEPPASPYPYPGGYQMTGQDEERKKTKLSCLMLIFGSRQLGKEYDRETYVKVTVRELAIYSLFLLCVSTLAFGTNSSTAYYFTKIVTDLFVDNSFRDPPYITFRRSTVKNDFWGFVEGPMIEGLYWQVLYSGASPPASTLNVTSNGILFENRLVGAPRMRQLRVSGASCTVVPTFRRYARQCYGPYEEAHEDKSRWGPFGGSAWEYTSAGASGSSSYWGQLAWYSGGGSYVDLFVDDSPELPPGINAIEATKGLMGILKEKDWITRATRVVFLDFTVYNANINLFCVVKLVWEFAPTGGVLTTANIETLQLLKYVGWFEQYVIFPFEIIFCIFTIYYIMQEGFEMVRMKFKGYVTCLWSWIDLGIIFLSLVVIVYEFLRYFVVEAVTKSKFHAKGRHVSFDKIAFWQGQNNNCLAVLVFLAWIKVFKFMSFNKTMTQLSSTLSRCAADIGGFAIMFFIVFATFAQLGHLMFGSHVKDFGTFIESVFTLLRLILGDFNFQQIQATNRLLGPLYFIAYVFFVFFVLLVVDNMFLAIINDTFGEVKAEIQARRNQFEIADYFSRGFNNMRGMWGKKNEKLDAKYAVKLASADGRITHKELRENLERAGFSDVEIEMFLARYQLDENRALDEDEIEQVLVQLEGQRFGTDGKRSRRTVAEIPSLGLDEKLPNQIFDKELDALDKRVDTIETSLSTIIRKVDDVANKMKKLVP